MNEDILIPEDRRVVEQWRQPWYPISVALHPIIDSICDRAREAEHKVAQMVEAWETVDGCPRETMLEIAREVPPAAPPRQETVAGTVQRGLRESLEADCEAHRIYPPRQEELCRGQDAHSPGGSVEPGETERAETIGQGTLRYGTYDFSSAAIEPGIGSGSDTMTRSHPSGPVTPLGGRIGSRPPDPPEVAAVRKRVATADLERAGKATWRTYWGEGHASAAFYADQAEADRVTMLAAHDEAVMAREASIEGAQRRERTLIEERIPLVARIRELEEALREVSRLTGLPDHVFKDICAVLAKGAKP
jgi:hypothetical protein